MKTWIAAVTVAVALLLTGPVLAHEGHLHKALGTIAKADMPHLDIKTTDGKMLTVMLGKDTAVTRGKDKVDAASLKTGERVSVEYMEEKGMNMAKTLKLAVSAPKR